MRNRVKRSGHLSDWVPEEDLGPTVAEESQGAITKAAFSAPPKPYDGSEIQVRVQPSMSRLFDDPMVVLEQEMARLATKATEVGLSDREVRKYRDLVDSLVKLSREHRAIQLKSEVDDLSDVELQKWLEAKMSNEQED